MPRKILNEHEARIISAQVVGEIRQALYHWPAGVTNSHIPIADATQRYIAVPPVMNPSFSDYSGYGVPQFVQLYRANNEFFYTFNSTVNTLTGSYQPAGTFQTIPLNPAVQGSTLAFIAASGTDVLRVNWGWI